MKDYLQPVTRKDLRAFLGSVGYYRRFIDGFAKLSSSLTPATSVRAPGRIQWTPDMLDAFHSLRKSLCNFCVLNVPCSYDKFVFLQPTAEGSRDQILCNRTGGFGSGSFSATFCTLLVWL